MIQVASTGGFRNRINSLRFERHHVPPLIDRLSALLVRFLLSYQMLRSPVYSFEGVRQQYLEQL